MSPVTHFLAGWLLAATPALVAGKSRSLNTREQAAVVAASVVPDLDGLGAIPELLTRHTSHPLLWFSRYHHSLHTLLFALIVTVLLALWTNRPTGSYEKLRTQPILTALLIFASFHLHLLCDIVGSRGPDGESWPIPYLEPFPNSLQLSWSGQWQLNGWQNFTFTAALLFATFWIAGRLSISPLQFFSRSWDRLLIRTLHRRFMP